MDPFEAALAAPGAADLVGVVTRLYLLVLGRAPDPGGLRDCVVQLHAGATVRSVAAGLLGSGEFGAQAGAAAPEGVLRRHARGSGDGVPVPAGGGAAGLAEALVRAPAVKAALPVLPTLFPDGLLLDDPAAYRVWLAGLAADRDPPGMRSGADTVSVLFGLAGAASSALGESVAAALALDWPGPRSRPGQGPGPEVVVAGWRFGPALSDLARRERRLRLVRAPFWFSEAQCLGWALARCRGSFTAMLGAGDVLRPAAAVPAALAGADIVLADEDAVDGAGLRHSPLLGAAWDAERALAAGRTGLVLVRTGLLRTAGGLGLGLGLGLGGPALALLLRAAARTPAARIVHVPALALSRSVPAARPGVEMAARHLVATGQKGCAVEPGVGALRIVRPLPEPAPRASIIIATRDRAELLGPCLEGLLQRTDYPEIEVVVVDNGSTAADALAVLERAGADPRVRVLRSPGPFNWAALNNAGARQATGAVLVLLNNDTVVVEPGWLRELVAQAVRPEVGAVGAKLLYPDGTIQHAGVVLGRDGHAMHMWRGAADGVPGYMAELAVVREVAAVTGACLAIRKEVFARVGGCDAANLPVTWNDVDLCLRVRASGLRVIWTPHARLLHLEQASRGSDTTPENDTRFLREQAFMRERWGDAMRVDPFLSELLLPSQTRLRLAAGAGEPPSGPGGRLPGQASAGATLASFSPSRLANLSPL